MHVYMRKLRWNTTILSLIERQLSFIHFLQVYIIGHMPPGSDERQFGANSNYGHTTYSEKNNARYLSLIRKYSSIIQGQFFGHLHSDSFRIVYENGKLCVCVFFSSTQFPVFTSLNKFLPFHLLLLNFRHRTLVVRFYLSTYCLIQN